MASAPGDELRARPPRADPCRSHFPAIARGGSCETRHFLIGRALAIGPVARICASLDPSTWCNLAPGAPELAAVAVPATWCNARADSGLLRDSHG